MSRKELKILDSTSLLWIPAFAGMTNNATAAMPLDPASSFSPTVLITPVVK